MPHLECVFLVVVEYFCPLTVYIIIPILLDHNILVLKLVNTTNR